MPLSDCNNLDDYLTAYGQRLAEQVNRAFDPLHVPGRDPAIKMDLARPLFEAQSHTVTAIVKGWHRQKSIVLAAGLGTGKTSIGIAAAHAHAEGRPYRCLVFCPDHLQRKWAREIRAVLPPRVAGLYNIGDWKVLTKLRRGTKPKTPQWWIIGRNKAKLGPFWRPAVRLRKGESLYRCPVCGNIVYIGQIAADWKQLASTKRTCVAEVERRVGEAILTDTCGAPLWQYDRNRVRRWAPATYIHQHLKGYFDYLIVDEVHEEKSEDSLQGRAAGSLAAACRKVLALTGTLIGGYANHVRPLLFRLSPQSLVQEGMTWKDRMAFLREYGRIETTITDRSGGREQESTRTGHGNKTSKRENPRPGIMPTLYGRHLLGNSVFLSLEEVAAGLPELSEVTMPVEMTGDVGAEYVRIEKKLRDKVKEMMVKGDMRLLGKMLHTLLSYPDYPYDWKAVGYWDRPRGTTEGGTFVPVVTPANFSEDCVYPKEQALIDLVAQEREAGRQCWVYVQYTTKRPVAGRLERLLKEAGFRCKMLKSSVPLKEREPWIEQHAPGLDVVISHPKLVETGLDLFCKQGEYNFPTLIFYETGYQLFTLRQASRRSWRIAQREDCKVFYLYYEGTMQENAMGLMGKKLTASLALEGKFSAEGLAAMAGEEGSVEMELARSLADRIQFDTQRHWSRVTQAASMPAKKTAWGGLVCPAPVAAWGIGAEDERPVPVFA